MGSALGILKVAAKKTGVSIEEYHAKVSSGQKWCTFCRLWHDASAFGIDKRRYDGLTASCLESKSKRAKSTYQRKPYVDRRGRRYAQARDGDKVQARGRVNHLVDVGLLINPNDLLCVDCGHIGGSRRHEYDHYKGYSAEHHESVQPVCSTCHAARHLVRRKRERDNNGRYK